MGGLTGQPCTQVHWEKRCLQTFSSYASSLIGQPCRQSCLGFKCNVFKLFHCFLFSRESQILAFLVVLLQIEPGIKCWLTLQAFAYIEGVFSEQLPAVIDDVVCSRSCLATICCVWLVNVACPSGGDVCSFVALDFNFTFICVINCCCVCCACVCGRVQRERAEPE